MGRGRNARGERGHGESSYQNGETIPLVAEQTHLGSVRFRGGAAELTVRSRCQQAAAAKIRYQRKLLGNKAIPLKTRVRFLKALVLPTLFYGLESMHLPDGRLDKLESTQCQLLRGTTHQWRHKGGISNTDLRRSHGVPTIRSVLRYKRLVWWQRHLSRSSGPEAVRTILQGEMTVGAHRVGVTEGLLWPKLQADFLALGVELNTPLLGMSESQRAQFLIDTPKPQAKATSCPAAKRAAGAAPGRGRNRA